MRFQLSKTPDFTDPRDAAEFLRELELAFGRILLNDAKNFNIEGWTPVLTFATPGNLSVAYSQQTGLICNLGGFAIAQFDIVTTTFTHTTASGNLQVTGLPYASRSTGSPRNLGGLQWRGITFAGTATGSTQVTPLVDSNSQIVTFVGSGSAVAGANIQADSMPTGGTVNLRGSIAYFLP